MLSDIIFKRTSQVFSVGFVAVVVLMGVMLSIESFPALKTLGVRFFLSTAWNPVTDEFGLLSFVYGTIVSSFVALIISVPLSIGIAVFVSEIAPKWLKRIVSFVIELLAAIPSVIYGLWGLFFLVPILRTEIEPALIDAFGFIPLFRGPPLGIGMGAASIILAIMVIPIISSIAREVLEAVPNQQREAALALGATRWETIRMAVLRYGAPGLVGAVFLGLGRALGETMAVTMLIGNRPEISPSLFAPAYTMASVIANEFAEASGDLHLRVLSAIGLALFAITLLVNALARLMVSRMGVRRGGAL